MSIVGVLGCGAMGKGMIKNLLRNGFEVLVYDVETEAAQSVKMLGATPMTSIQSVAEKSSYLLTSLPSPHSVEEALIGGNGAVHCMEHGSFILDMSTTDVDTTRKIYAKAKSKGVFFFDCPVSGGPDGAQSGELTIMVGGDLDRFEHIELILTAIGKEIEYIGETGSGQAVKLCNNMVVAGLVVLLSETFLTGVKAGVPVDKIAELMQKGSAQNKVLSVFGPNLMYGTHENVKFLLSHMTKDVNLYLKLAKQEKVPTFLGSIINQLFEIANNNGKGGLDTSAVSQVLEKLSNDQIALQSMEPNKEGK